MISTAKSILGNEIWNEIPVKTATARSAYSGQSRGTRHNFASYAAKLSAETFSARLFLLNSICL